LRKHFKKAERKASRIGEVRLELNSANRGDFKKLVEWKIDKCRRTHVPCTFARNWSVRLVEYILAHPSDEFSGMLLSLHVGDQLAAVEFSIRSGKVLHEWLAAYNRDLSDCSPGLLMEHNLTRTANSLGITRIDLGKGDEQYKSWFASDYDQLAEGAVHVQPLHAPLYRALFVAKNRLRSTSLRNPVQRVRRWTLSTRVWLGYND